LLAASMRRRAGAGVTLKIEGSRPMIADTLLCVRDEAHSFFVRARIMKTCLDNHFRLLRRQKLMNDRTHAAFKNTVIRRNERA
jgi:hypothetical protein